MLVFDSIEKSDFSSPSILSIGTFDGVHLGHKQIFQSMHAHGKNLKKVIITFNLSPQQYQNEKYKKIISFEEKLNLFKENQIDITIALDFTPSFASLSYLDFLLLLKSKLNFSSLVLGEGSSFGKDRLGTKANVKKHEKELGFESIYIPKLKKNELEISSSNIKELIKLGDIFSASRFLGRPFELEVLNDEISSLEIFFLRFQKKDIQLPPQGKYWFKINDSDIFFEGSIKNTQIEIRINDKITLDLKSKKRIKIFNSQADIYL